MLVHGDRRCLSCILVFFVSLPVCLSLTSITALLLLRLSFFLSPVYTKRMFGTSTLPVKPGGAEWSIIALMKSEMKKQWQNSYVEMITKN